MDNYSNSRDDSNTSNNTYGTFAQNGITQDIAGYLYSYNVWIIILSIISIIAGILLCFTIIGIVIAWLPIWLGVILYNCYKSTKAAYETGDTLQLENSLAKISLFFKINGILTLISIIIYGITLITGLAILL